MTSTTNTAAATIMPIWLSGMTQYTMVNAAQMKQQSDRSKNGSSSGNAGWLHEWSDSVQGQNSK
jgi:hypothetical protein